MKTLTTVLILATAIASLTSCGSKKSSASTAIVQSSTVPNAGSKVVTSCQKASGSDMSVNISALKNSSGSIDNNVVKIKFNRLSAAVTAAGNTIAFFKWRVAGASAMLDATALDVTRYSLSSDSINDSTRTSVTTSTITSSEGYYITLNDAEGVYQVIKAVVYNTSGAVVAQQNILIPQFLAVPADYAYNSDGSARAQILRDLHPLASVDVTSWTSSNFVSYFQATCF